jgi:hypothetical protein
MLWFLALAQRSLWLLLGVALLLASIVLLGAGGIGAWTESRYEAEGRLAEGIVIAKQVRRATGGDGTEYRVSYRFTTEDDQLIRGTRAVGFDRWEALMELAPITIEYLPDQPGNHRIGPGDDWAGVWTTLAMGALAGLLGSAAVTVAWRRLLLEQRLRRQGMAVEGRVVAVEPTTVRLNGELQECGPLRGGLHKNHVSRRLRDCDGDPGEPSSRSDVDELLVGRSKAPNCPQ